MLLRYCLSDFEMVPVIAGVTSTFTFHMRWNSVMSFYILKSSQLLSWSHFCLQELQHLLTSMFVFYCNGLWCSVYC
jgi:hypothetical protein